MAGNVFDETGGRLTPSHTKTAKGRRRRYYVSHRLVRSTGSKDPSGWRLPAPELEELVTRLIRNHLSVPALQANIVNDASSVEVVSFIKRLTDSSNKGSEIDSGESCTLLPIVERVEIKPGNIE